MKTIPLIGGYNAIVDDEDYDRAARFTWYARTEHRRSYVYRREPEQTIYLHRFVLGICGGDVYVDHRNHDGFDNQRSNLRVCDNRLNQGNRRKTSSPAHSRFKGVSLDPRRDKWKSYITIASKYKSLGYFSSEIAAAHAYNAAALQAFGDFAYLNEVTV